MKLPGVLVVEDDPVILLDIAVQLDDEGFEVYEAQNFDAALSVMEQRPDIGLIFTDIEMPGPKNGLGLAAVVRERWPAVKIIITSGARVADAAAMPEGSIFFTKPYQHDAVRQSIGQLLDV